VLHPHLHCLVTGGGVTDQGEWRAVRNGFLLPVRVVMAVFRGKLLAALETAVHEGTLTLPDGMYAATKRAALASCRAQLGQEPMAEPVVLDWQTACRERGDAHPERCPRCGRLLVRLAVILPARIPPPEHAPEKVVA
jgi:Putative transposase